jgi:hypothetical protein
MKSFTVCFPGLVLFGQINQWYLDWEMCSIQMIQEILTAFVVEPHGIILERSRHRGGKKAMKM